MQFWKIFGTVTLLKLLFMNFYRSTDFEVHRNWLAITYSLPLSEWYTHDLSEWTLDYPPFFAYFEYGLAQLAQFFDPKMLDVQQLNYISAPTIVFQRMSVIVMDLVLAFGVRSFIRAYYGQSSANARTIVAAAVLGNFGLLIIDHIHFQYNGFMFGILLLSIAAVREERFLVAALLFAVLLHLKHIFMYMAPVYFVYLLRFYCLEATDWKNAALRLIKLGAVVISVTLVSLGPFLNQLPQLVSRLFPFKRGLCHAYWAPNFWALYNVADKVASIVLRIPRDDSSGLGNTGGLVQDFEHVVLPSIPPSVTFVLSALAMLPCLFKLFLMSHNQTVLPQNFVRALVICGGASFLFGWHVHEKAILMVSIPLSLLCFINRSEARSTFFLSIVAHYSLFPLLFLPYLMFVKVGLFSAYTSILGFALRSQHGRLALKWHEQAYLVGFLQLFVYENGVHVLMGWSEKLPFLPLMMVSTYSALGVVYFWVDYYIRFMRMEYDDTTMHRLKKKGKKAGKKLN